jgi:tripartite-type tricarboxylate transporter receptor subunit TctC
VTDLLGGQVQVMFNSVPASIEYIKAGTLRVLAVTTATRSDALPDIPTMLAPSIIRSPRRRWRTATAGL